MLTIDVSSQLLVLQILLFSSKEIGKARFTSILFFLLEMFDPSVAGVNSRQKSVHIMASIGIVGTKYI